MRYTQTMSEALADVREGFSKKEIKMAIGVASDPRYKQGNYTGAVNAIEKIKKGLSKHPQVAAVLKRQNEEVELDEDKISKKGGQLQRVINSIVVLMKKDPKMKKYAMEFEKDAKKTEDPRKSLDNVTDLPFGNYAVGDEIGDILNKNEPIGHMVGRGKVTPVYKNKNPRARVNENVELDEAKYKYDGKVVKISKKEFAKVSKDYKNTTKGKERMMILDPKTQASISVPVQFEELELDEGKMKDLSMKIDSITAKMKKDKQMKSFADKFKKDAMKSMDIKKSLEKILPDYIAGKDIAALVKEAFVTLFTSKLDEGTWAVPETPAQKRDLKRLMSKPLPLGKEGDNAADKMYSIIGDDELFDDLYVAGKKDPEGDARPIIKQAMKRLKIKEDRWFDRDSWRLDESTKPDHIKVFNSLKKGDKVEINYDSSMAGGSTKTFVIRTKNKVYKGKVDKVTMYPDGKTGGVKFHLYQYDNRPGVYMAIGDMGASLRDIKKL